EVFGDKNVDAVVVVVDEAAFLLPEKLTDRDSEDEAISNAVGYLHKVAATARRLLEVPVIVATVATVCTSVSSADIAVPGTASRFLMRLNAEIAKGGENRDWIVWDLAGLASRLGTDTWFDVARFHQAKTPFRIELCPLVADHLARIIAAMTGKSARALV